MPRNEPGAATSFQVPFAGGAIAAWRWGSGPAALLVHGWEGSHADMLGFVEPMLGWGLSPIAFDLPGHGASGGTTATIPQMAAAVVAVGNAAGGVHGIIAHSVACVAAVVALTRGLDAMRVVLISTPTCYRDQARSRAARLDFDEQSWKAMEDALLALGTELNAMDLRAFAPRMRQPALFIHSADDRILSIEKGRAVAAHWPGAIFVAVEQLGHMRILRDDGVIRRAVDFLAGRSGDGPEPRASRSREENP